MRLVCAYVFFAYLWRPVLGVNLAAEIMQRLKDPTKYDATIRPDIGGDPVEVEVDVVLNSIGHVNEIDMTWTASFYLRQEWSDSRLVLDGTDNVVRMAGDQVSLLWLPDMFFSNCWQGRQHDLTVPNLLLNVNTGTGRVLYSQRLTMTLNCKMDLTRFPHDNQTCTMDMESYSYTTDDLMFKWSSKRDATSLLTHVYIPDFRILDITTEDCSATYAIGTYACLRVAVVMDREIGFYLTETYLPSILIVDLSWVSFWIDHDAIPARISVGLLTVLTLTTQLSGSRAQLPRVPYIKAIDVWMSTNLVFVFAAYMEFALVTVLSRRYKKAMARKAQGQASTSNGWMEKMTHQLYLIYLSIVYKFQHVSNGENRPDPDHTAPTPPPCSLEARNTGRRVDKVARVAFPLAYFVFNISYWAYYLTAH